MILVGYGYGRGLGINPIITILLFVMIGVSIWASFKVSSNFEKFSKVASKSGMTGREVARMILNRNGLSDVDIQQISGSLTDHYDPRDKVIRLSESVYDSTSIAAISVAAHEVGHAIQDKDGYLMLNFRSLLAPVVGFTSRFVFVLIFMGFLLEFTNLINLGIALYSLSVLFHIVTLPVELNASKRALDNLTYNGIITVEEKSSSKKVLGAAAMTYVASMLVSILQLLRFISMRRD
ncbi:zinc metallopeptidase [Helcococcus ovis]|uniref:Zinc metallopeptidase n=4 Tax=Helcococcus ovis TaxID=72026 RepID=A0A4R9C3Y8_9FIRM|nr:zinc metallopeptidase [Helcococcus ovis]TFF63934.1 zinc metallopeptidase [Helcococcus ovis]TFF66779.1 zinc metallopeptidase [Helcococcus ovis]TFF67130.1 zinc metallopeptidase [Helcococcus ovis]WNZ01931.1 zinc metallopeptidase [Helcococcus ovis]